MMKKTLFVLLCCLPLLGQAKEAEYSTGDPVMHMRVMALSAEFRCLVCQGQSLADSHSDFALDIRAQIQELMEDGMSDSEVTDFMVQRYGDYVRYRPPFKSTTVLLWFGPFILLGIAILVLYFNVSRRKKNIEEEPLTDDERRRAEALLKDESGDR